MHITRNPSQPKKHFKHHNNGGEGFLVWSGIIMCFSTDFHAQCRSINGQIYQGILRHLHLLRGTVDVDFIIKDGNGHSQCVYIVTKYFEEEGITGLK
ncbi:hypothetical protein NPIL_569381 [Nephila pilipes]|uniref:Uncharacterized protein n=1 Tax=Nephila pilipes TaxID=299642 RepID=A0A8X6PML5_NEPPI|nr:hypothetical protein NPIL_569381 [Nephila pilipes]